MDKNKVELIRLVVDYGEMCKIQGSAITQYGYGDPQVTEASSNRVKSFDKLSEVLKTVKFETTVQVAARPVITTLCGSSRFPDVHMQVMMHLTLAGRIVIPMGCYGHADVPAGARFLTSDGDEKTEEKQRLDELHFRKIDVSDGILVVNAGGYVGSSTRREVGYARSLGKTVEWLFPDSKPEWA